MFLLKKAKIKGSSSPVAYVTRVRYTATEKVAQKAETSSGLVALLEALFLRDLTLQSSDCMPQNQCAGK